MTKKRIGLGFIIAAAFFLFNPIVSVIDVIPDFLGYLFLSLGLSKFADINENFATAKSNFTKLIYISLAKVVSIFMIMSMPTNEISTFRLTITFVAVIVELIFLIPAMLSFFDGFIYIGSRRDSAVVLTTKVKTAENKKIKKKLSKKIGKPNKITLFFTRIGLGSSPYEKTDIEKLKTLTILTLITILLASLIPEFTSLNNNGDEFLAGAQRVSFEVLRPYIIVLFTVGAAVLGLLWLIRFVRFFAKLNKDKHFVDSVNEDFQLFKTNNPNVFIKRRIFAGLSMLMIAFILRFDLLMDLTNLLPGIISSLFYIAFFVILKKESKSHIVINIAVATIYGIVSTASWVMYYNFRRVHTLYQTYTVPEVKQLHTNAVTMATIESILFVILFVLVSFTIFSVVKKHTGSYKLATTMEDPSITNNYRNMLHQEYKELKKSILIRYLFTLFTVIGSSILAVFAYQDMGHEPIYNFLNNVVIIVFIILSVWFTSFLKDEVSARYLLD